MRSQGLKLSHRETQGTGSRSAVARVDANRDCRILADYAGGLKAYVD